MTESQLHKLLKKRDPKSFMHRIENVAALGTFDTYYAKGGRSGWIELKIAGPNAKPEMRSGQPGFGERLRKQGIPAHVLCCSKSHELKLLNGWVLGDDWREHLVMRGHLDDPAEILERCLCL